MRRRPGSLMKIATFDVEETADEEAYAEEKGRNTEHDEEQQAQAEASAEHEGHPQEAEHPERNKLRCIAMMDGNHQHIAEVLAHVRAAAAAAADSNVVRMLQEAEDRATGQAKSYIAMMSELQAKEFKDTGQLESMIQFWRDDFEANIQRLTAPDDNNSFNPAAYVEQGS